MRILRVTSILISLSPLWMSTTVWAAQATCVVNTPGADTWSTNGDTTDTEGTSANIVVRKAFVCDSDGSNANYTNAGVGVLSGGSVSGQAWAGYRRWANATNITAAAWYQRNSSDSLHFVNDATYSNLTQGSAYHFWSQFYNANSHQRMNVNTHVIFETSWNIFGEWQVPFTSIFGGDAKYIASDVAGLSTAKARFSNMEIQMLNDSWTGSFTAPISTLGTTRWTKSNISGNAFDMWTSSP